MEKLEAEMKGYDCDAMVKEHLRALNEVRLSGIFGRSFTSRLNLDACPIATNNPAVQRAKGLQAGRIPAESFR